jgi:hypothetical protein
MGVGGHGGTSQGGQALRFRKAGDIKPRDVEWLWRERIPLGELTLIGGRPGRGKSLCACYLAAEVSQFGYAVLF